MAGTTQLTPETAPLYEPFETTTGLLEQMPVTAVVIPRADYLEAVMPLIAKVEHDSDRERLEETARTQDRFAMDDWINRERGCGCLVGEFLVASDQVDALARDQAETARQAARGRYGTGFLSDVETRLQEDFGSARALTLVALGQEADTAVEMLLWDNGADGTPSVVFIRDAE
jgi:hypothetical protein